MDKDVLEILNNIVNSLEKVSKRLDTIEDKQKHLLTSQTYIERPGISMRLCIDSKKKIFGFMLKSRDKHQIYNVDKSRNDDDNTIGLLVKALFRALNSVLMFPELSKGLTIITEHDEFKSLFPWQDDARLSSLYMVDVNTDEMFKNVIETLTQLQKLGVNITHIALDSPLEDPHYMAFKNYIKESILECSPPPESE